MTETKALADVGMVGLGVMGANLARNLAENGHVVAVHDRDGGRVSALAGEGDPFLGIESLAGLVSSLARPRRIIMLVPAGAPVDAVLEELAPLLDEGDIVVDGGNSLWRDTARREAAYAERGLCLVGMGVSGGAEGARRGPALMPGGSPAAWEALRGSLESIAARTEAGACVAHVGPGGAGHFVKMVHNGIEYADMQLIAEVYDLLRRGLGCSAEEAGQHFAAWNEGPLESFLVELTGRVLSVQQDGTALVDQVLDRAGQKGTGRWTVMEAVEHAVPIPTIAAALDARVLSSLKGERVAASKILSGPARAQADAATSERLLALEQALLVGKLCAYAQGLALIQCVSDEKGWEVDLAEMARIWGGGCIIRAGLLATVRAAYSDAPPANLLVHPSIAAEVQACAPALRRVVAEGAAGGIPVPALASSLAYLDAYRTADLPQNLVQAQRDAFGGHTYQRRDDPEGPPHHSDW